MTHKPSTDDALRMAETALHSQSETLDAAADTLLNDETIREATGTVTPALRSAVEQLRTEARRFPRARGHR